MSCVSGAALHVGPPLFCGCIVLVTSGDDHHRMVPTWLTDTVTTDLDRALRYTHLWGFEAIVLRSIDLHGNRVPACNERKLKDRLRDQEIAVAAVMPGLFEAELTNRASWMNELLLLEEVVSFCQRIDCPTIVLGCFQPGGNTSYFEEVLSRAAETAGQHGISLAFRYGPQTLVKTLPELLEYMDAFQDRTINVAWDPLLAMQLGETPAESLRMMQERLGFVSCYNASGLQPEAAACLLDEGVVHWSEIIADLQAIPFVGPLCLEVRVDPLPKTGLKDSTLMHQWLRLAMKQQN